MSRLLLIFFFFLGLPVKAQNHETGKIKIGCLVQDKSWLPAKQGAELAVSLANSKGGINRQPLELVLKSMEGPWGTGSNQAVDLIFKDQVWVLLGSHDGRNGHLVEQAATKSIIVFMSSWSSDPTLTQAFVPWCFNVVPTDLQQAQHIVDDIYKKKANSQVLVISDNTYDSKQALKSFLRIQKLTGKSKPVELLYDDYSNNTELLKNTIRSSHADCLVLLSQPSTSLKLLHFLNEIHFNQRVYGSISILNENLLVLQDLKVFDHTLLIPSGKWSAVKTTEFVQAYRKKYGTNPGMSAAFAFDGMNLFIEAIRSCGCNDREKIQEALYALSYEGVTGLIKFDTNGNRSSTSDIYMVKNGLPDVTTK